MILCNESVKVVAKSCYDILNQRRIICFSVKLQVWLYTICFKNNNYNSSKNKAYMTSLSVFIFGVARYIGLYTQWRTFYE